MNLAQRVIVWLGCNALILLWLQPPVYQQHSDGSRNEHQLEFFWNLSDAWTVNVPLVTARIAIIVLVTIGMALVFSSNKKPEAKS
jgi:hypothetical protein